MAARLRQWREKLETLSSRLESLTSHRQQIGCARDSNSRRAFLGKQINIRVRVAPVPSAIERLRCRKSDQERVLCVAAPKRHTTIIVWRSWRSVNAGGEEHELVWGPKCSLVGVTYSKPQSGENVREWPTIVEITLEHSLLALLPILVLVLVLVELWCRSLVRSLCVEPHLPHLARSADLCLLMSIFREQAIKKQHNCTDLLVLLCYN